jgi:metallo-beta-lactamase family protein
LLEGAHELKFFGKYYPVKAEVHHIESLSAHADQKGLINWMSELESAPSKVFLVHGESTAADSMRVKVQDTYGWKVQIPDLYEIVEFEVD